MDTENLVVKNFNNSRWEIGFSQLIDHYKLLVERLSNRYHVSWNLELRDIANPAGG